MDYEPCDLRNCCKISPEAIMPLVGESYFLRIFGHPRTGCDSIASDLNRKMLTTTDRWGCRSNACQIRYTIGTDKRVCLAMERAVQSVPSFGWVARVLRTKAATLSSDGAWPPGPEFVVQALSEKALAP